MRAGPGNVIVTSLTCDGDAQWVDSQNNVYTSAQCEAPQCSETYCEKGTLTGNPERTTLSILTCDVNAQWIDGQSTPYTVAQCEIPCDRCPAITNDGMTCLTGFKCTPVLTKTSGKYTVLQALNNAQPSPFLS
ncbi:unnamed protein product [Strongylus vulgaris]|uniref:Uncharacterized protein n=1 Tax=Strongylus vulgaris TaxID=40348 RepID=A0A3P7IWG2_STRVU|nr:unnamed protein product [Strongylus vulgaris]